MDKENRILSVNIEENINYFNGLFNVESNFDIMYKNVFIAGRKAAVYFVDGFTKDELWERLFEHYITLGQQNMPVNEKDFADRLIPYGEINIIYEKEEIIKNLLSGISIMIVDGYAACFAIDCRQYPARNVTEPEKNRSLRGSRDGFVETLVYNTALIRRRIRDTDLVMEMCSVGETSKTDIVLCYMGKRIDVNLLTNIKERINNIKVDSLTMNQESLAECLYKKRWINPFPKMKFSERPDTTAAAILEGGLVILVDNAPHAMIIPTSIFDLLEEADDYYFPPVTGTYLRLSRLGINILAVLLTPTWMLMVMHPQLMPDWLLFTQLKDMVYVPLLLQFIILEFAIDGLRLAALNTPTMLSTPLSVIAALVIGDNAVSSGWFNSETMLYMAFVALANYTQPSFELGYALKFMRLILLVATGLLGIYGYIGGIIFVVIVIVTNKTIAGKSYIYPLIPFNIKNLFKRFLRLNILSVQNNKNN
ncbi:MAG: spore germination protein [Lachnospiraceae bacterium]|nr:spore germination protein [Lachnospiraceae bacterium]